jgi:hypothetical protein
MIHVFMKAVVNMLERISSVLASQGIMGKPANRKVFDILMMYIIT